MTDRVGPLWSRVEGEFSETPVEVPFSRRNVRQNTMRKQHVFRGAVTGCLVVKEDAETSGDVSIGLSRIPWLLGFRWEAAEYATDRLLTGGSGPEWGVFLTVLRDKSRAVTRGENSSLSSTVSRILL